ncbi:ABC transporter permease [Yoonia sediminilitoris]|uniref:Putative ABC transport system permease protein n=1 Tax=Yoonia sediminilitoris TaxID=1286148 RepID=A0A2T6KFU7_9RHOB|nr:FtsX-like permease family protein [Yoonia sediminilitoris]PUB14205.1 putative ABC transport system permease protein [Yoonia sediminilitoris]RCW95136.1 putative ABC transport system permease protein [Yoonia sediminilitoris]
MSLRIASRFALRELRGGLRGFRVFLACLALGVAAIAAVGTVRAGIEAGLKRDGAALLGGDAEVEFTYRFARDAELAWIEGISDEYSETVDFRSMAVVERNGEAERGLTQIRAVDDAYPLIGAVQLSPDMSMADALADKGAVMERVLVDRLGLTPGDSFRLGTQDFTLRAVLDRYPDNSAGGFGLGPRTIVLTDDLANSGLISEGTLFSTEYRLDLPPGADLQALEASAEAQFRDTGMRWRDSRRGAGGAARFVERIGAFLILVGLSGLAVGGVGVSAAVRSYLAGKTGVIATLKTLGATRQTIFLTYFLQVGVLTLVGIMIGLVVGAGLPVLFAPVIEAQLPIPAAFAIYPMPLVEAAIYGLLAALVFTLWPLAKTEEIRAATLFRDAFAGSSSLPAPKYLVAIAVLIAALIGAAIWFSGTVFLTLWTAGGIAGSLAILVVAAVIIRWIARRFRKPARGRPALRLALGSIGARGGEATSVVLSLGLGLTVLAAVGQIDGNLRSSFADDLPEVAPSYFFVDIQPDQIDGFMDRLNGDEAVSRVDTAPMLRGIITQINGQSATEVAGGHWVIRGDRGITYADAMPKGTEVTRGAWWPEGYTGPPQISFAEEEAREIGLELGDTLTINVLGRDITGKVTSFRNVSWEDAGIGFVLAMNEAALAGAPHSWISTVYAEEQAEAQILRDLATSYPNITAIRIRDAIDQVIELVGGISAATRYGALITLVTGFLVLIGAAAAGERARTFESAVLKTLGASRGRIMTSFALRAGLLGLAAGVVALGAGILGGWAVSTFIMESDYSVIWSNALLIIFGGVMASLLAGLAFAWRPLAAKPAQVLRARE